MTRSVPRRLRRADILAEANRLAGWLAETALAREAADALPFDEVDRLRESGLLAVLVPEDKGGSGGDWTDALAVTRAIARGDGSIGHLIGYQYLNYAVGAGSGSRDQVDALDRGVVEDGWFLGDSVNPLDPGLTVREDGDTVILDGRRSFATGAAVADRVLITFRVGERDSQVLLPRDRAGFLPQDDWDNIGQRLTASGSVVFDRMVIHRDELLGWDRPRRAPQASDTVVPTLIQAVLANVDTGIAAGALDAAAAYTRAKSRPWPKSGVARAVDDPYVIAEYGRMAARLAATTALADDVSRKLQAVVDKGAELTAEDRAAAAVASFAFKIESTNMALDITSKIFEVTGARASARQFGFDRYWRDIRTITLHDPVSYKLREVGEYFLNGVAPTVTTYS